MRERTSKHNQRWRAVSITKIQRDLGRQSKINVIQSELIRIFRLSDGGQSGRSHPYWAAAISAGVMKCAGSATDI